MKNRIFSHPQPDGHLPRNAFDRGFSLKYNFSAGIISPVFAQPVVGGSKIKLNLKSFVRSASVNTSAMTSCTVYTDFYVVPISQLFSLFGQFKTKTNDVHSTVMGSVPTIMPQLTRANLNTALGEMAGQPDYLGFDSDEGAQRLGELLNLGFGNGWSNPVGSLNMLTPCAYQKVYYDHYRNTSYEANDPEAYNLDQFAAGGQISVAAAKKMLALHYCNYKKDYFSNIFPSLNYLASSANGLQTGWTIPSSVVGIGGTDLTGSTFNVGGLYTPKASNDGMVVSPFTINNNNGSQYGFSVQNLRAAFALDKLLRASAYAPQHVKDQYEARYGFKSYQYNGQESQRIGSYKFDVVFGEVVSTADTDGIEQTEQGATGGQSLGNIGGKGIGGSDWQHLISADIHDDSIVIGVQYAIPRTTYDSLGVDKFNQKFLPTDFFQPEFMDLGLQPVEQKELFSVSLAGANTLIMGYQPRYSEYKVGIDRNALNFRFNEPLTMFTMHGRQGFSISNNGVNGSFFKVSPSDMDSIFVQQYDGRPFTDQFFGMFEFAFACVAPMSVHGQPRL